MRSPAYSGTLMHRVEEESLVDVLYNVFGGAPVPCRSF